MAYLTNTQVKTYIGGISGSGDDALLTLLISNVETFIENWTGRVFDASSDTTRNFDAVIDVDGMTLYLDHDLCSITTVTNGDSVVVSSSEYVTQPRNKTPYYAIKLLKSSAKYWTYSTDHENAISIVGAWGYSATPPADILQATYDIVKNIYRSRDSNSDSGRTIITGGVVITPADVPQISMRILNSYRRTP